LFTQGSFCKVAESAQIFWATSFHGASNVPCLTKTGLGYISGDFFSTSSGHLDATRAELEVLDFKEISNKDLYSIAQ
jgi:hypothetical protein